MATTGVKTLSEVVKELKERLGDQQAAFDADIKAFQQTVLDEYGRSASSDDVAKFTKDKPELMAKIFHTDKDAQFVIGLLNGIVADKTELPPTNAQVIAKLKGRFGDAPDVVDFLSRFSGIPLRVLSPPSAYIHKSPYLRENLPGAVGSPNTLDLRLLSGNLDNPAEQTLAVSKTLKRLDKQESLGYADMHVFLTGHAMGKTKAIFDIACTRYTILLDAGGENLGYKDITDLHISVDVTCAKRSHYETQIDFEHAVQKCFLSVFGARLIMLQLYLAVHDITPIQWRDAQLNGLVTTDAYDTLVPINNYLLMFKYKELDDQIGRILAHHKRKTQHRIVASFDEANIWLDQHFLFTPPPKPTTEVADDNSVAAETEADTAEGVSVEAESVVSETARATANTPEGTSSSKIGAAKKTENNRPVWYAVAKTFFFINALAMVVAGTRIRLRDTKALFSSAAKVGVARGRDVKIHTSEEFVAWDYVKILRMSSRVFTNAFTTAMRERLAERLCGNKKTRPRFFMTYVELLPASKKDPMFFLDDYIEDLVAGDDNWTLVYQLNKVVKQFPTPIAAWSALCDLLLQYICADGQITAEQDTVDWMAGGICLLERVQGKLQYQISENLIVEAIDRYLLKHKFSVVSYCIQQMKRFQLDTANCGALFDFVVAWAMRRPQGLGFLKIVPWASSTTQQPKQKKVSVHTHVVPFLQGNHEILVPDKKVRIDTITKHQRVHIFSCQKVSFQEKNGTRRSVDASAVRMNHRTTNLSNIYTKEEYEIPKEDPQYTDTRREIFKWYSEQFAGKILAGIVRLHICLPFAPKKTSRGEGHKFVPGTVRFSERKFSYEGTQIAFPEASIDIDSSCLKILGIFMDDELRLLSETFPLKKGQSEVLSWAVVNDDGDAEMLDTNTQMPDTTTAVSSSVNLRIRQAANTRKRSYSILQEAPEFVRICDFCQQIRMITDFSSWENCCDNCNTVN